MNALRSIALLLPLILLNGCASRYAHALKPTLTLQSLAIRNLNLTGMNLDAEITVENPNDFDIPVDKLEYTLLINDQKLMDGASREHLSVPENGTTSIHLPLHLDFTDLFALIDHEQAAGGAKTSPELKVTGTVTAAGHRLPFEQKKVFKIPSFLNDHG